MTVLASRSLRRLTPIPLLVAGLLAGACMPDDDRNVSTPAATIAVAPTARHPSTPPDEPTLGGAAPAPTEAVAAPTSATTTPAATTPRPDVAAADPEPFAMNLYRRGDFVAQYTFEWCVGASLQMALNMSTDGTRSTKTDQQDLWAMARDRSFSPFGGANPRGWTAALNDLGIGPYRLVSLPSYEEALTVAAEAIRATRRPVGLVMWRGRHAWVMSGFESTDDPRRSDEFELTGIRVLDPLYPHGSSVWGPSPKPNTLVTPETLAEQFVLRDSTRVDLGVPPGYLLVLPVAAEA